jgi:hypothetical protein
VWSCGDGKCRGKFLVVENAVENSWWWKMPWKILGGGKCRRKFLVMENAVENSWWH